MLQKNLLLTKTPLPKLTDAQHRILDYLLSHPDDVAYMSSSELAGALDISNATVVRFSQHIGFKGYLDLQRHIRQAIKASLSVPERLEKKSPHITRIQDFIKTVFKSEMDNLATAARTISPEAFESLVKEICDRDEIWVLGLRSCHGAAHYFATNLRFLLRRVNLISLDAGTVWSEIQPGMAKDALLISISFPRYCRGTLEITKEFQKAGATIAAITDSPASPLARMAGLVFSLPYWIDSFFESNAAVMSFLNAVLAGVSFTDGPKTRARLQNLEEIWEEKRIYTRQTDAALPSWARPAPQSPNKI